MPITAEQRIARRQSIGSSDSAAIVGLDPWRSPYDIYLSKVHELKDDGNELTDFGNRLEPVLLDWASEEIGLVVEFNVSLHHPKHQRLTANLDGMCRPGPGRERIGIEAKTTGQADEFGEPGTDQIPDRIIVQCLHQIEVAELEMVYVPVLLARRGRPVFEMFVVKPNVRGQQAIVEADLTFWEDHVAKGVPPSGAVASLDVLKRIERVPNKMVEVQPALVDLWEAHRRNRIAAEKAEEEAKANLLAALGDAESATFGEFGKFLNFYPQTRKEHVVAESTFRVLRVSKKP